MLKTHLIKYYAIIACVVTLNSCKEKKVKKEEVKGNVVHTNLREALTFYASFDTGVNADFSKGDSQIYTVPDRNVLDSAKVGLWKPDIIRQEGKGKYSSGLQFTKRSDGYIYYPSAKNIAYNKKNWSGAVSFWLSLDPATDLEKGYCDPIQITDVRHNDAAIWVDFTDKNPRDFRLGVIGDRKSWNPKGLEEEGDLILPQVAPVISPPFGKGEWTHILINFSGLNTKNGKASLYLNGELKSERLNIMDPFTWELDKSNIYLGLSYVGFMDDLSIYNRNLTGNEIKALYSFENGVQTILK